MAILAVASCGTAQDAYQPHELQAAELERLTRALGEDVFAFTRRLASPHDSERDYARLLLDERVSPADRVSLLRAGPAFGDRLVWSSIADEYVVGPKR